MTRLECASSLIWNIRHLEFCTNEDVEATARAVMELGRSELREELERPLMAYEVKTPREMEGTGAPVRVWM